MPFISRAPAQVGAKLLPPLLRQLWLSSIRATLRARGWAAALVLLLTAALAGGGISTPAVAVELERLEIVTAAGPQLFSVEVMRTDDERAKGLMLRRFMPADRGMLFDFKADQPVMMWMRNTIIPLDMLFIGHDGAVVNIAENTEPMSETTIPSDGPVTGVLELNAGTAARLSIKKGDRVRHTMFGG